MKLPELKIKVKREEGEKVHVDQPNKVADVVRKVMDADTIDWTEEMILLLIDRKGDAIGWHKVSSGGRASTICDPKTIFTMALKGGAESIIVAHNHPSGSLEFSDADVQWSKKLRDGGKLLDIQLLDSLIVTSASYRSMADELLI